MVLDARLNPHSGLWDLPKEGKLEVIESIAKWFFSYKFQVLSILETFLLCCFLPCSGLPRVFLGNATAGIFVD